MATPLSSDRRRVESGWHTYRLSACDAAAVLRLGWKRISGRGEVSDRISASWHEPDCIEEQQYNLVLDKARSGVYRYPFPVAEPNNNDQNLPSLQTAYISARTRRTYLCSQIISQTRMRHLDSSYETYIWLTRPNGQHVGYLQLHSKKEMEAPGFPESLHSMELVATCKGYTADISVIGEDWNEIPSPTRPAGSQLFCTYKACYFVLWIEWIEGVAYRKASGAVAAEVWEQDQEKEPVDLILG